MNLQPVGDRVLIKVEKEQEQTVSGIVLPDTVEKKSKAQGAIVAMGAGEELSKLGLSVGDVVLFGKYAGDDVEVNGEDHKIINAEDIIGVYKNA